MDRSSGRVAAYLHRMIGNRDAAADLAQETFVKLHHARERYRPVGNFSSYLFGIAANLARNLARWVARHPTLSLDATPEYGGTSVPEVPDPSRTPAQAAQAKEKARAIHQAFLRLPPDLRETMTLFVDEGMGYAEIASVCQCSPKAMETRI